MNKIIALIVSYNNALELKNTVIHLIKQVNEILVLDNNSNSEELELLSGICDELKVEFIQLKKNYGISGALNYGFKLAKLKKARWVLTMDQDSAAMPGMVSNMIKAALQYGDEAIICPTILKDSDLKEFDEKKRKHNIEIKSSITSGNLIPMELFEQVGEFNEDYFIDSVDFEYNLRARNKGYKIIQSGDAYLKHKLGDLRIVNLILYEWNYVVHNPLRRYYMYRNHIKLSRDYFRIYPIFIIKKTLLIIFMLIEILIFDKNRYENIKYIVLGIKDGIMNRNSLNGN